jgi:hypothetical protein
MAMNLLERFLFVSLLQLLCTRIFPSFFLLSSPIVSPIFIQYHSWRVIKLESQERRKARDRERERRDSNDDDLAMKN